MLVAVIWLVPVGALAFQIWVMVWPAGNVQTSDQLVTGSPRLVSRTAAPKPPPHWLVTEYVNRHAVAAKATPATETAATVAATAIAANPATSIAIDRTGASPIFIPAESIRDARTDRGLAGKVMFSEEGLLVVQWENQGHLFDTGFRGDDKDVYEEWVAALVGGKA